MNLHPEDLRYWIGWLVMMIAFFVLARIFIVQPIVRAIDRAVLLQQVQRSPLQSIEQQAQIERLIRTVVLRAVSR